MTHLIPTEAPRRLPGSGFWRKTWAVLVKEFIQLKRDRVSFAMIIMIPLVQLMLFGYAINTTPRDLPTAVLLQEHSDLSRSILAALQNTRYFKVTQLAAQRGRTRPPAGLGQGAVRGRNPRQFRARRAARREAGDAGGCRRHRSGRLRLGAVRPRPVGADGAGARPRGARKRAAAVRYPRPCPLQPGRRDRSSTSCRAWSAPFSP